MGRAFTPSGGAGTPFEGQEILATFVCPPLQGSVNDYSNGSRGFANASLLSMSATGAVNVTGLVGATANRELILLNTGAPVITLKNANAGSAPANRFQLGTDVTLAQNEAVKLIALAAGGWASQSSSGGGGGGGAPSTATFVTEANETGSLPNSFRLAAGAGISLTPAANVLTVAAGATLAASVHNSVNQSINSGAAITTALSFDTADFDTGAPTPFFNAGTPTVLTAPVTGLYLVTACAAWGAVASSLTAIFFIKNGNFSALFGDSAIPGTGATNANSLTMLLSLVAGDTVSVAVFQDSGGAIDVDAGQVSSFGMALL
jgi:hypothetical protein